MAAAAITKTPVKAVIHLGDEILTAEMAERFTTLNGGIPSTWEEAVLNRINKQNLIYKTQYSTGSPVTGVK